MDNITVYDRIRADMLVALKKKDVVKTETLKSALSRIDNATSIIGAAPLNSSHIIAGASEGLGSSEVPRRTLSEQDINELILDEIEEIRDAILNLKSQGQSSHVVELEAEVSILKQYLN